MEHGFVSDLGCSVIRLNRTRRRFLSKYLKTFGLSWPMYLVLSGVFRHPGSSQEFLSDFYFIDKTTVARCARRLEELSFLRREVSPEDRRVYRLYLTAEGENCAHEIQRRSDEWSRHLAEGFSEEERRTALTLLSRMSSNSDLLF
jgi:DNA-binding MarR family transcriptional regulator